MDWEEAIPVIFERFYGLEESDQIAAVEFCKEDTVTVFRTMSLNSFCKRKMNGDYTKMAQAVVNGMDYDSFDLNLPWCMYDETTNELTTGNALVDFVYDEDELEAWVVKDTDLMSRLGFSSDEIQEMQNACEQYEKGRC